jgi:hypothetical protein
MHWINLAQDKDKWPAPVSKAVKIRVPYVQCEELWGTDGFLRTFMFFVPRVVIQLCNVKQQNALFKLMF